jgi:phosphopantothenoylcysteine synthetase/decarboxylase
MIIAPCTATTLGKLASAICDNPLISVATALPPDIPLVIAPAMDSTMWMHPATQRSLNFVKSDGAIIIPPVNGDLSSGFEGPGRLPEIVDIVKFIEDVLQFNSGNLRYKTDLTYSSKDKFSNLKNSEKPQIETIFDKPNEPISDAVDKDKWNAEFELDKLKKNLK